MAAGSTEQPAPGGAMLCFAVLSCLSCLTLCDPMDCSLPGSSVHGDSPGENIRVGCHAHPTGDLPNPGIELGSPALQAGSIPAELPEKPQITKYL